MILSKNYYCLSPQFARQPLLVVDLCNDVTVPCDTTCLTTSGGAKQNQQVADVNEDGTTKHSKRPSKIVSEPYHTVSSQ